MKKRNSKMHTQVLEVLEKAGTSMSAYDILAELKFAHPKLAPPTIYRALASLVENGCVHRLETKNAFIACTHADHSHTAVLAICNDCGAVEEASAPKVLEDLTSVAAKTGFKPSRHVVEIIGQCGDCAEPEAEA